MFSLYMFLRSLKHTEEITDDVRLHLDRYMSVMLLVSLHTVDTVHMLRNVDMWITGKVSYNYHDYYI